MNFKTIPQEERSAIAHSFMVKGICPICEMPMRKKNGLPSHSKTKSAICEELLREALKVQRSTITMPDGRNLEIDARFMSKDEAEKL